MSDDDFLSEVDLCPRIDPATAHNSKGGRKSAKMMFADLNHRRPRWRRQLYSHMAQKARHPKKVRAGA